MERLRMCLACRNMMDKKELVRIVKDKEGNISVDPTGKKNGRGAYICKSEECMKKLQKQKLINKAFSCQVPEEVYKRLEEELLANR